MLFLDDLHWADVSTIDILNYLAGRFADMRVLVLTTYRPAEMALAQHPFLGIANNLRSRGLFEEIGLGFLGPADVDRYLALEFPEHRLPQEFSAFIHAKTEGSPLFMADLVRYLRDSGSIVEQSGTWVLARAVSDMPRDLPESVRSMIARKIEQVDERDRALLLAASVQGTEFDSAIVSEAMELDPAEVEQRLDLLERVHVFVKRGAEYEFPDLTLTLQYQFVHALYQNMLYASLQPTRRAALSGRVAKALVAHGEDTPASAARLAVLFEAARDFATSARYYFIAAQHSVGIFAFREALSLAERGLEGAAWPAGRAGPQAAGARTPDDPWAGPENDEGLGRGGARTGLRAGARTVPRARRSAGSISRPVGAHALPRHSRRPSRLSRARGRAHDPGRAVRESRLPDGGAPPGGRIARVPRQHGGVEPGPRSRAGAPRACRST